MKKITISVLMVSILLTTTPTSLKAEEKKDKTENTLSEAEQSERNNSLLLRLDEINTMDKSDLTYAEKKELRKEVRAIKKAVTNGGVYLSVGAIIIIVLLLIILL